MITISQLFFNVFLRAKGGALGKLKKFYVVLKEGSNDTDF